jgi:hypothetical protein
MQREMLPRRLTTILPAMSLAEALETTRIPHVPGRPGAHTAFVTRRPFGRRNTRSQMKCPRIVYTDLNGLWLLSIFDTDGEVRFAGTRTLTNLGFTLAPNENHVPFRLRH